MTKDQLAKCVQEFCDRGQHAKEEERYCTDRELRVDVMGEFFAFLNLPESRMPKVSQDIADPDYAIAKWAYQLYGTDFSMCTPNQKTAWRDSYAKLGGLDLQARILNQIRAQQRAGGLLYQGVEP